MPKVPKIKAFYLFYINKIDQTEGCSETLDHFSSLQTLDHFDPPFFGRIRSLLTFLVTIQSTTPHQRARKSA
jgi:hypothetical protein